MLTVVCAKLTPCEGVDAEHLSSSPLAAHWNVVCSDGGWVYCQYSMPGFYYSTWLEQ